MNHTYQRTENTVQHSRDQRLLLGALFGLSVADGFITRFIISHGLGSEGNSWIAWLAGSDALIVVKIAATALSAYLLWLLYQRRPRLVMAATVALVCWYTLVVFWNTSVVFMAV